MTDTLLNYSLVSGCHVLAYLEFLRAHLFTFAAAITIQIVVQHRLILVTYPKKVLD